MLSQVVDSVVTNKIVDGYCVILVDYWNSFNLSSLLDIVQYSNYSGLLIDKIQMAAY